MATVAPPAVNCFGDGGPTSCKKIMRRGPPLLNLYYKGDTGRDMGKVKTPGGFYGHMFAVSLGAMKIRQINSKEGPNESDTVRGGLDMGKEGKAVFPLRN